MRDYALAEVGKEMSIVGFISAYRSRDDQSGELELGQTRYLLASHLYKLNTFLQIYKYTYEN